MEQTRHLPPTESDHATAVLPPPVDEPDFDFDTAETIEIPPADAIDPRAAGDETLAEPAGKEGRWERLKRGFWKHMYETPVDMSPMGPTIQPQRPFEEWYAEKQAKGPGVVSRAVEKTAEKLGEATEFVDYVGNIALIDTAYYAGTTADAVRAKLEDGKDVAVEKTKKAASGVNRASRRIDDASNAAMEQIADFSAPGIEAAVRAKEKASKKARAVRGKMGNLAVDATVFVSDRIKRVPKSIKSRVSRSAETETSEPYKLLLSEVPDDYHARDEFASQEFGHYDQGKVDLFKAYLEKQIRDIAEVEIKKGTKPIPLPDSSGILMENSSAERFLRLMIDDVSGELLDYGEIEERNFSDLVKKYLDLDVTRILPGYHEKFQRVDSAESD